MKFVVHLEHINKKLLILKEKKAMKRLFILFALVALCGSLAAQNVDYTLRLKNNAGKVVQRASLFTERGTTDENGCFKINAKFKRGLLIAADGYEPQQVRLEADPIVRVVLSPTSGPKATAKSPKSLETEFECPLYVINGTYCPTFEPSNYTDEMIAEVTTTKKWNKVTRGIFKDTDIESIDVVSRGVVVVSTTEEIVLNTPKNKMEYTLIITDGEGHPIKDAMVYVRRASSGKTGVVEFASKPNLQTVIQAPNHEDYRFSLPETCDLYITMTKRAPQDKIKIEGRMPTFNSGDFMEFRRWFTDYTRTQLLECRAKQETFVKVKFVVGLSGDIVAVDVIESNNPRATSVVKRALYRSPKWEPGMQGGKPKRVSYVLPVNVPAYNNFY